MRCRYLAEVLEGRLRVDGRDMGYSFSLDLVCPLTLARFQKDEVQARASRTHVRMLHWCNIGSRPEPLVEFLDPALLIKIDQVAVM